VVRLPDLLLSRHCNIRVTVCQAYRITSLVGEIAAQGLQAMYAKLTCPHFH